MLPHSIDDPIGSRWRPPQDCSRRRARFGPALPVVEELQRTDTPGAAVVVVSGDRVIFAKGFGTANVETGAPVTPDTSFRSAR